jgi:long-subunit acyl-CoA synthetase (AMP-forming)
MSSVQRTDSSLTTLPAWLQEQARRQPAGIALRHKHLGIWQVRSWAQVAEEVRTLADGLQANGFGAGASLLVLSRPRPEALLLSLAAQWLGGEAALFDPLEPAAPQAALLSELQPQFLFAEGLAELRRVHGAGVTPGLLLYADKRGVANDGLAAAAVDYQTLLGERRDAQSPTQARADTTAFALYRQDATGELECQRISHSELLQHGLHVVQHEQLGRHEEALAARAFAAGGQARYLLAPWLITGFRLNFPESLATRDHDRRELGPTLVAGTRETYRRLHTQVLHRLPEAGSWRRRLVDWALRPAPGSWRRGVGYWLIRRPLRDVLGFSRTRAALLVGEPLDEPAQAFFNALGINVRTWPDPAQWHSPVARPALASAGWSRREPRLAEQGTSL